MFNEDCELKLDNNILMQVQQQSSSVPVSKHAC